VGKWRALQPFGRRRITGADADHSGKICGKRILRAGLKKSLNRDARPDMIILWLAQ
jgi:hypothetical protein